MPSGTLYAGSASSLYAGSLNIATKWDAVNAMVGQRINFNENKILHLAVSLQWTDINPKFVNYPRITANAPAVFVTTGNISYTGVGPRAAGDTFFTRKAPPFMAVMDSVDADRHP